MSTPREVFDGWLERAYQKAIAARARVESMPDLTAEAERRLAALEPEAHASHLPMSTLAYKLTLDPQQTALIWCVVACSVDGRIVPHLEALGGAHGRRGLSLAVYAALADVGDGEVARLAHWLASPNPLVGLGLVNVAEEASSPAARAYVASPRLVSYLAGDEHPIQPLRLVTAPPDILHDAQQRARIEQLRAIVDQDDDTVLVVEGPMGSGRATAASCSYRRGMVVLDVAQLVAAQLGDALIALRRECVLGSSVPVLANVDHAPGEDARDRQRLIGDFVDGCEGPLVITATAAATDVGTSRPLVRITWPLAEAEVRAALWERAVEAIGGVVDGELGELAHRYRVGPAAIHRAAASIQRTAPPGALISGAMLAVALRHNIAEQLGSLADRVEVTQTWEDLVLDKDTLELVHALVARARFAHQVLDRWGYRRKIARGAGIAALFSGPPGTGKTMVAGLIARDLGLELYQVDLSKVTSKWVGETEKNLARLFDAAEAGHALLLFDEADALFGQRSAHATGANDRYANLEVNYLLQRVEAFGGVTILTTNMDTAIDVALKRRLAAHVVFTTPDEDERAHLWLRQTITGTAPLSADVSHAELAREFPNMSGANIRNAAISAAFMAAAAGALEITQDHLTRAARAEYRSMGHMISEVMAPRSGLRRRN